MKLIAESFRKSVANARITSSKNEISFLWQYRHTSTAKDLIRFHVEKVRLWESKLV